MGSKMEPRRRATRIVPAIPRKFERKANMVKGDSRSNPNQAVPPTTQDFGIERHGKLPPPFIPTEQQSTLSLQRDLASEPPANGIDQQSEVSNAPSQSSALETSANLNEADHTVQLPETYQRATLLLAPAFPANPTPPADDPSEAVPFQYPYQTHPPFIPFQHQTTPPSDATPSPTHYSYQRYPYLHNVSFQHSQNIDPTDPSTPSAYQGYAYAPSQTHYQSSSQVYDLVQHSEPLKPAFLAASEASHDSQIQDIEAVAPSSSSGHDGESSLSALSLTRPQPDSAIPKDAYGFSSVPGSSSASKDGSLRGQHSHHEIATNDLQQPVRSQLFTDGTSEESTSIPTKALPPGYETALSDLQHVSSDPPFSSLRLSTFLSQNFNSPQYADCRLCVVYKNNNFETEEFLLHRVVVAQSPALATLLATSEMDNHGIRLIHLEALGSFLSPTALRLALQTSYGQSPWDFIGLDISQGSSRPQTIDAALWMRNALAFAAAGNLLQLEDVVARGVQIASTILSWDNIETALAFTMEGLVDSVPKDCLDKEYVQPQGLGISSATTPPAALGQSFPAPTRSMTSLNPYRYGVAAYRVKQLCLRYLCDNFPTNWKLNKSAHPSRCVDRLPVEVKGQAPSASSRFRHIQFGSLPALRPEDTNGLDARMSSIVLSIPYSLLQELLEQADDLVDAKSVATIVSERERRRQQALKDQSVPYNQRAAMPEAWGAVGWEESVTTADVEGTPLTTISREWTGFRNPSDEQ